MCLQQQACSLVLHVQSLTQKWCWFLPSAVLRTWQEVRCKSSCFWQPFLRDMWLLSENKRLSHAHLPFCYSPCYNCTGWLGIKLQVTYSLHFVTHTKLLTYSILLLMLLRESVQDRTQAIWKWIVLAVFIHFHQTEWASPPLKNNPAVNGALPERRE